MRGFGELYIGKLAGERLAGERVEGEDRALLGPAKGGRGGFVSMGEGPLLGPEEAMGGMVICVGRCAGLCPDREAEADAEVEAVAAGRQICSPIEERGIGSPHDEQVIVGRATDARSCVGRTARRDMSEEVELNAARRSAEVETRCKRGWRAVNLWTKQQQEEREGPKADEQRAARRDEIKRKAWGENVNGRDEWTKRWEQR